mmetsp:Transcript_25361/g.53580  ORF Transcript_25361/g.53580 Transcript_25361/m.53580 type:complete len:293 (+) Transcript_25361:191-1069(+)
MIDNNIHNVMDRIKTMLAQEKATRCCDYFQTKDCNFDVDESSRESIVVWYQQLSDALDLSPETIWIALSFFDRYLSSGEGKSKKALEDKHKFQVVAITAFYTAIKAYEPVEVAAIALGKICQDYYSIVKISSIEKDMLFTLHWRVSCPTSMEFVRHFVALLPERIHDSSILEDIIGTSLQHLNHAVTDFYFAFHTPSVVGACCLASTLIGTDVLSSSERRSFYLKLARIVDLIDVMEAQIKLLNGRPLCKPITVSNIILKSRSIIRSDSTLPHGRVAISSTPVAFIVAAPTA